ncbi:hypothetical protein [Halobacillus sp. B29]|uniref:hypothetical protein n=1 Tax=Halobacillus sp. B29 TaxID=3457432 RepID=UPI003FCE5620
MYYDKKNALKSTVYNKDLLKFAVENGVKVPQAHKEIFMNTKHSEYFYQQLYIDQKGKDEFDLSQKPNNSMCRDCHEFFLGEGKLIDKSEDLKLGNELETVFQKFLESTLNGKLRSSGSHIKIKCQRADTTNKHMPDLKLTREGESEPFSYLEFKCIFRPYLKIKDFVHEEYNCYSHSLTLDIGSENKKLKLLEQRKLVEENGLNKTDYVYWYDTPCLKGVFYMNARGVYHRMDHNPIFYKRVGSQGDYNEKGYKIGSDKKIYLPLSKMGDFRFLLNKYYLMATNKS